MTRKNPCEPADVGIGAACPPSDLPKVAVPASPGLPAKVGRPSSIFRWLANQPEFQRLYELACLSRTHALAEEIIAISDDDSADWIEEPAKHGAGLVRRADNAAVQRARLKVDSRKWLLSKLQPRKYGDRVSAELTGANGGRRMLLPRQRANRSILHGCRKYHAGAPFHGAPAALQAHGLSVAAYEHGEWRPRGVVLQHYSSSERGRSSPPRLSALRRQDTWRTFGKMRSKAPVSMRDTRRSASARPVNAA